MSDLITALLGGSGIVGFIGAVTVFYRTRRLMAQQDQVTDATVIERLSGTVGGIAEDVRRNAQETIDLIRRDAQTQIDRAALRAEKAEERAEKAERRAVEAERAAVEAQIKSMDAAAVVRRLTNAVHSQYATIEGLRAMLPVDGTTVNGR